MMVIMGATGQVGGEALRRPVHEDVPVRALVRGPAEGEAVGRSGVEADAVDAAVRAGVRRVMKLSVLGAEAGSPVPFRDCSEETGLR